MMFILNFMLCVLTSFEEPYLFSEKITISGNINVYLLKNGNSTGMITLRLVNKQAILRRDFKL